MRKSTAGRRLPQVPPINRLTSLPDSILLNAGDYVKPDSNTEATHPGYVEECNVASFERTGTQPRVRRWAA
jgi:hypothetical protein